MKRSMVGLALVGAAAGLAAPGAAAPALAQQVGGATQPGAAWLGVGYEVRWLQRGDVCQPQVLVESVIQGSPAERAGLRAGDALVAVGGTPLVRARLETLASRLSPGEPVRLRIERAGVERELVAVADRRPARPPTIKLPAGSFAYSGLPSVRMSGDTLIGRDIERLAFHQSASYMVQHANGRTEYRRVERRGRQRDELDDRVQRLVSCAARSAWAASPAAAPDVEAVRLRADSLRIVIGQRALARADDERAFGRDEERMIARVEEARALSAAQVARFEAREPRGVAPTPSPASALTFRETDDGGFYVFRFEDHAAAAERGVAGAEVTALEPELASYFRGASAGVLVLRVSPGTPADRAGLRPGDVITSGNGTRIADVSTLRRLLALPDARPLTVDVVRHGRTRTLTMRRE